MAFDTAKFFKQPDFNGDGKADYLWRNAATGEADVWLANGAGLLGTGVLTLTGRSSDWTMETADFNGDGKSDIFSHNNVTGENVIWLMNGTSGTAQINLVSVPTTPNGWNFTFGDFNGDKKTDFFWRNNTTGETSIWLSTGDPTPGNGVIYQTAITIPTTWTVDLADFNGDGKTDLFWRNTNQATTSATYGQNAIWIMNGATPVSQPILDQIIPAGWNFNFADFNGDGKTDIFWRYNGNAPGANPAQDGLDYIWLMNGTSKISDTQIITVSSAWNYDLADFNGDGKTDFFWRASRADTVTNLPEGTTAIWLMNGAQVVTSPILDVVPTTWQYELGDFNGDGKTDFFWRNSVPNGTVANGDGLNQIWLMDGTGVTKANLPQLSTYNSTTDGDWNFFIRDLNGDGKTDIFWRNTDTNDQTNGALNGVWLMDGGNITNIATGSNSTTAQVITYFNTNTVPGGQATVPIGDRNNAPVPFRWYLADPDLTNLFGSAIEPVVGGSTT